MMQSRESDIASNSPSGRRTVLAIQYAPGLTIVILAALAAAGLASMTNAPVTLLALLVGLSLNFLESDLRLAPGLDFASRTLLRCSIVLLGAQVTLAQYTQLGAPALGGLLLIVGLTIFVGVAVARRLGFDPAFGLLAGGSVAICGASAAVAIAAALGVRRIKETQLTLVLVGVSAFSALAMIAYPLLCRRLQLDDTGAGFVLGAAIHDVAQSLGAGYGFSWEAGQTAAIVKLSRVALLAPILVSLSYFIKRGDGRQSWRNLSPPWFVVGFFLLAAIHSLGLVPAQLGDSAANLANTLLVCAVTATGIRSPLTKLLQNGWRPLLIIALASATSLCSALAVVALFQV